jgi:hypothetical protein
MATLLESIEQRCRQDGVSERIERIDPGGELANRGIEMRICDYSIKGKRGKGSHEPSTPR